MYIWAFLKDVPDTGALFFIPKQIIKNLRKEKNPDSGIHKTGTAKPLESMVCVPQGLWRNDKIGRFGSLGFGIIYGIFASAIDTLKILVIALGAGLGAWGVINLLEGYGNDNPGAKSQG